VAITYNLTRTNYPIGGQPLQASYTVTGGTLQTINLQLTAGSSVVPQANSWNPPGLTTGSLIVLNLLASQPTSIQTNGNGTIGVQIVTITGSPTTGIFALGFKGAITAPIAYNATAAATQTALGNLSTVGTGNVTCTGGPFPGSPVTCTFSGPVITTTVPLMTSNIETLVGGSPAITIANATNTPQDVLQLAANIPFNWDSQSGLVYPFQGPVTALYLSNTNYSLLRGSILTV